jgi:hypothetical protein
VDHHVAECDHEVTPLHSMTRSALASSVGGISMPSVFEIDDQLELGRLFNGQIAWVCSIQYLLHVIAHSVQDLSRRCAVADEP